MKTAISLPDELFREAEKVARKLHISRSALFATALAEYVARHREDAITEQMNRVCEQVDTRLPADLRRAAKRVLLREPW